MRQHSDEFISLAGAQGLYMSTGIRALPDYRCVVAIIEGKLQICRMGPAGELDFFAGQLNWEKVRYPSSEDFLRAASHVLKIEITHEHLEGYRPR